MAGTEVLNYDIWFYGGPQGYQSTRVNIGLYNPTSKQIGAVRFYDPGVAIPNDSSSGGVINMCLPSAALASVIDTLRNEKPVYISFTNSKAMLTTSQEPVGEGES